MQSWWWASFMAWFLLLLRLQNQYGGKYIAKNEGKAWTTLTFLCDFEPSPQKVHDFNRCHIILLSQWMPVKISNLRILFLRDPMCDASVPLMFWEVYKNIFCRLESSQSLSEVGPVIRDHRCRRAGAHTVILPSLSLSLSGRARGPVSDQSPRRRRRFTGGCLSCGNTHTFTEISSLSVKAWSKIAALPKQNTTRLYQCPL